MSDTIGVEEERESGMPADRRRLLALLRDLRGVYGILSRPPFSDHFDTDGRMARVFETTAMRGFRFGSRWIDAPWSRRWLVRHGLTGDDLLYKRACFDTAYAPFWKIMKDHFADKMEDLGEPEFIAGSVEGLATLEEKPVEPKEQAIDTGAEAMELGDIVVGSLADAMGPFGAPLKALGEAKKFAERMHKTRRRWWRTGPVTSRG